MHQSRRRCLTPCKCCSPKVAIWKQCLEAGKHGCAVCLNVLTEDNWKAALIRDHKATCRDLVCRQCFVRGYAPYKYDSFQLQCSRCGEGYEDAYWTGKERMCHRRQETKLVCKPCRSLGFHPRNIVSYTCKSCKGKFGSRKFSNYQIANFIQDNDRVLTCMQCVAEAKQKKTAGSTSAASFAGKKIDR